VHKLQYDDLEKIITERVQILRSGSVLAPSQEGYISTVDSGSMISRDRFLGLQQLIRKAEEAGAKVVGGQPLTHVYLEHGSYFQGTVVGPVHNDMDIAQQERA
jgi:acyl-CoA reductase-like NAD-dependent aldehyde dehydrogenase